MTKTPTLFYIQFIGLITIISYVYFLPKMEKSKITQNMPQNMINFSLFSIFFAVISYLYIVYNSIYTISFSSRDKIIMTLGMILFLISSTLWAPLLYYSEKTKWAVVSSLLLVSLGSIIIGIVFLKQKTPNIWSYVCVLYFIFHTTITDGTLWNKYFLNN